jgi:nucleoside-diphosphate-sugar epimerase
MREGEAAPVILTGATGFLGGHLMAGLLERGRRLVLLGRAREETSFAERVTRLLAWFGLEHRSGQIETVEADLLEPACGLPRPLRAALCAQAGPIIHCAADTRFSERNRREITATNVHGLRGILNLAAASRASFFHYISTAYVAGRTSGCCSEQLVRTSDFTNVYEETKARAEHEVAAHCAREGLAHTIIRPSIVYGDSRTGRSTRFTALYYPVKSLLCLRDIYLDDIRHHGGKKAQACGILLEDGGVLRLPLRIFLARRGQVNLIPIDYFVAAVMSILERAEAGTVYHLTSESPTTIDDLGAYSQAFLKVAGLEIIDGPPNGARLTPPEALFQRFIEPYLPYLADTRSFDRRHARRATVGLNPPELTYEVFERCMGYAMSVNWGNGGQAPAA